MSKIFGLVCMLLVFGFSLQAVEAQDGAKKKGKGKKIDVEARFNKLDANGDKKLSKDEFLKGVDRIADKIAKKDKDKADKFRSTATAAFDKYSTDGSMTLDQYKTYAKESFKGRKKKNKSATDA